MKLSIISSFYPTADLNFSLRWFCWRTSSPSRTLYGEISTARSYFKQKCLFSPSNHHHPKAQRGIRNFLFNFAFVCFWSFCAFRDVCWCCAFKIAKEKQRRLLAGELKQLVKIRFKCVEVQGISIWLWAFCFDFSDSLRVLLSSGFKNKFRMCDGY